MGPDEAPMEIVPLPAVPEAAAPPQETQRAPDNPHIAGPEECGGILHGRVGGSWLPAGTFPPFLFPSVSFPVRPCHFPSRLIDFSILLMSLGGVSHLLPTTRQKASSGNQKAGGGKVGWNGNRGDWTGIAARGFGEVLRHVS